MRLPEPGKEIFTHQLLDIFTVAVVPYCVLAKLLGCLSLLQEGKKRAIEIKAPNNILLMMYIFILLTIFFSKFYLAHQTGVISGTMVLGAFIFLDVSS